MKLEILVIISLISVLITYSVEAVKTLVDFEGERFNGFSNAVAHIAPMVISLIIAFSVSADIDIFSALGIQINSTVGSFITALILSGGSNTVYNLIAELIERSNGEEQLGEND